MNFLMNPAVERRRSCITKVRYPCKARDFASFSPLIAVLERHNRVLDNALSPTSARRRDGSGVDLGTSSDAAT